MGPRLSLNHRKFDWVPCRSTARGARRLTYWLMRAMIPAVGLHGWKIRSGGTGARLNCGMSPNRSPVAAANAAVDAHINTG